MRVKRLDNGNFQIELTPDAAAMVATMCRNITGNLDNSPRGAMSKLGSLLLDADVPYWKHPKGHCPRFDTVKKYGEWCFAEYDADEEIKADF